MVLVALSLVLTGQLLCVSVNGHELLPHHHHTVLRLLAQFLGPVLVVEGL